MIKETLPTETGRRILKTPKNPRLRIWRMNSTIILIERKWGSSWRVNEIINYDKLEKWLEKMHYF
jgi:hypothetical protein